ncbi:MAG: DUF4038 domain-containing protein [Candidatus Kapabacteria bacterium]|nr:DUF4038 domain-containing protein [Candidatus Kapabacteria bacterium]
MSLLQKCTMLSVVLLCGAHYSLLFAQTSFSTQAHVHLPTEIRLRSLHLYVHPFLDVKIRATFTHRPSGQTRTVTGFWAGDSVYAVRFAPTLAGMWEYRITASDTTNRGLHGVSGRFQVTTQTSTSIGENPLTKHGFLRVSTNRRTLEHSDGTPFFWLGDTAWEMFVRGTTPEILRFLDDRAAKGFNVLQTTPIVLAEDDSRNRSGKTMYLNNDRTRINPRFFDEFDSIVTWANARGMIVALVPQWANGGLEGYDKGWVRKVTRLSEALIAAEYIAARYAGHQMVWVTGGDVRYDTPERRAYWERFANVLREADGGQHLVSIHPEGFTASYDFFSNTASWLDFGMLQSSHQPWSDTRTAIIRRGYEMIPAKPVLNAEPPYEDFILNSFFSDLEASFVGGKRRATAHDIRVAAYMSIFHGGLVGITYGANGIFQWNSATMPTEGHSPRLTVDSALKLPGAAQMGVMKRLLSDWHWEKMIPRLDLLTQLEPSPASNTPFYGVLASNDALVMYASGNVRRVSLACAALQGSGGFVVEWITPSNATTRTDTLLYSFQPLNLQAPVQATSIPIAEQDWLIRVRRERPQQLIPSLVQDTTALKISKIRSDRANGIVEIGFGVAEPGRLDIEVFDALGGFVLNQRLQVNRGEQNFVLSIPASGAYFYRATLQNERLQRRINGKFIQQ